MHVVAFGLSYLNLWPKAHEAELSPIELIVMEPPTDPVEEPEEQLPVEPAELSTETNAPTPAPVAQAPATRAAVVTAPPPTPVAPPEPVDVVEPEPIPETEVESELEVPEDPEVEPEPIPETEVESELEVPEDPEVEPEAEAPEAQLPPEEIEDTEAEADPAESNLATAAEDSSQLDRLHDFFQSQREAATEAPSPVTPRRQNRPQNLPVRKRPKPQPPVPVATHQKPPILVVATGRGKVLVRWPAKTASVPSIPKALWNRVLRVNRWSAWISTPMAAFAALL